MANLDDVVTNEVNSNIGRVVAFVVTPILLPVAGAVAFWLQNKTGINMNPAEATGFIASVVTGAGAVAFKWLHNRGEYEKVLLEIQKLREAGQQTPQA